MKKETKKPSLLSEWKNRNKNVSASKTIEKAPANAKIPLSHGQKKMWFLQELYPDSVFYNLSERYVFEGTFDIDIFRRSVHAVFEKHAVLKSYYALEQGEPVLKLNDTHEFHLEEVDFSNDDIETSKLKEESFIHNQAYSNFRLSEAPLYKASLLKLTEKRHVFFLTLHHIIADQWSMGILIEELASFYTELTEGATLNTDKNLIDFPDYAYWQSHNTSFDKQLTYWKEKFSGNVPILNIPTDFKRPNKPSYEGKYHTVKVDKNTSQALLHLAKDLGVTPFVLFLSAYYLLLHKFSRQNDVVIGTPVANRNNKALEKIFGLFIDTIALRQTIENSTNISQFINDVNHTFTEALRHKDIPLDILVKELKIERSLAVNPLFQTMFVYTSKSQAPSFGSHLKMVEHSDYLADVSKFDLTLFITEDQENITASFEYATDLFDQKTIIRFGEHLQDILGHILKYPQGDINEIPALSKQDKQLLKANNASLENKFQSFSAIHHIIEEVCKSTPEAIALSFQEKSITYKALNEKADRIAQILLKDSSKADKIVGLCIERSLDMIIGLLGILKAGCAYLPIDPEYPNQRIEFMLKDAGIKRVVTQKPLVHLFEGFAVSNVLIEDLEDNTEAPSMDLPKVEGEDLAYVIYTSGSTGKPKGVPITHKNIINSTAGRLDFYDHNPTAFLLMSSVSFDSSKAGIYWTLCTGGNLVISPKRIEQDIEGIANTIEKHKVSHTLMLPSLYNVILENVELSKLTSLNSIIVAGETCQKSLCENHFKKLPDAGLYNEYGPTEASVWCIAHKVIPDNLKYEQIPIGIPVANAQIFILDENKAQVPMGVPGEIYIGGEGLSKGYLNRDDLTNVVFVDDPFIPNKKLYKTGDIGKFRNDATIDFLGRVDQQIKIRGFRVEIDEIENTIQNSNSVEQVVVLVKQHQNKPKNLVAYIIPKTDFNANKLRLELKQSLPSYMIPQSFVKIEEFPFLPNGKVDKKSLSTLKAVEAEDSLENQTAQPKNPTEKQLLAIWKEVLGLTSLRTNDNFFEIGGDSILSIQIIAKARKEGIKIAPNQLFEHQSVSELAMYVSHVNDRDISNKDQVIGEIPLTPIQKWFFNTHKSAPEYWNQCFKINDLGAKIEIDALKRLTEKVIEIHDALRLSFKADNDNWKAIVLKPSDITAFEHITTKHTHEPKLEIEVDKALKQIQEQISLKSGSLFKCIYFETPEKSRDFIILLSHHLVVDFVSWQIIINAYTEALEFGTTVDTSSKTSTIKTWADHLTLLSDANAFTNELEFWKAQMPSTSLFGNSSTFSLPLQEKTLEKKHQLISKALSEKLTTTANLAYTTKTDELLLTALIETLGDHAKAPSLNISLERHGRESMTPEIDLSNTVGWFTSFFPKRFDYDTNLDIGSRIIHTKEEMRKIPNGGIGYGVLGYLGSSLNIHQHPEVVFNFLGRQNTGDSNVSYVSKNTIHPSSERHYVLEINALIKNDILELTWIYGTQVFSNEIIENLIQAFENNLKTIIAHCLETKKTYTSSDFPSIEMDQKEIDVLLNGEFPVIDETIEEIHPLNTLQKGILFHTLTSNHDQGFLNIQCTIDGEIDIKTFETAWNMVSKRHEVLRTTVHWNNLENPILCVNSNSKLNLETSDWTSLNQEKQQHLLYNLKAENTSKSLNFQSYPLSNIHLVKIKPGSQYLIWSCHHLLLDGWSTSIILKDFFHTYDALKNNIGITLPNVPSYKSYLNWQKQIPIAEGKLFWQSVFKGFERPFLFNSEQLKIETLKETNSKLSKDVSNSANNLAKTYRTTLNTLFQGIWGLIISRYSGKEDIIFGNTVSGRSGDFPNMNLMSGMFANVLPLRSVIDKNIMFDKWLASIQSEQLEARKYESFTTTEILEWIEVNESNLFDSLFIFENYPWEDIDLDTLKIHSSEGGITTTYPITITISKDDDIGIHIISESDIIDPKTIEWIIEQFKGIITYLGSTPSINVSQILSNMGEPPIPYLEKKRKDPEKIKPIVAPTNATELELLKIWEELLRINTISTKDNFFEIGGKSLLAIKMFSLIEKRLKIRIPPIVLLEHQSITALSAYIRKENESVGWKYIVPIRSAGNKTPLFCIHGGGGFVFFFNPIANGLPKDRPVYAIQPSGLGVSGHTHDSIEEMAKDYAKEIKAIQPKGPYNLLVYCFSPAVGIEIADAFNKHGDNTNLIVIDSIIKQEDFTDPTRIKMRLSGFLNRLKSNPINALSLMLSNNYERFLEPTVIKLFGSKTKKDLEKIKQNLITIYKKYGWGKTHTGGITLILTEKPDKNLNQTYMDAWKTITTERVKTLFTEGQHHQLFDEPYAHKLAEQVEKAIIEDKN